jgi:uncharacterized repeat protein (TIGR03803 family)
MKLCRWMVAYMILAIFAGMATAAHSQVFKTLVDFSGTNGANPYYGSLVQGTDGNLYGTTYGGGDNDEGTVFKVTDTGTLTTLYSFDGTYGSSPLGGLVQAIGGNFYGTAAGGGASNDGTVFKIALTGTLTTLHSFSGYPSDGRAPSAALIQATDGNFYGTTPSGGADNTGTVFEITPTGTLTTLHSFAYTDGGAPITPLAQATNRELYGTTQGGGANNDGTVFKITPGGALTTLYSFCAQPSCTDGSFPLAGLVQGTDGNFYGTTYGGGTNDEGTVFKIAPTGTLTTLHSFDGSDGLYPYAALIQGTDGNFYGTTSGDGVTSDGTVFKITPAGTLTTLHSFDGSDGNSPYGGLVQATDGSFYGTALMGGSSGNCNDGCGTIFGLSLGLGAFVKTNPASGKVGTSVIILGNNMDGTTNVAFNGTSAQFNITSSTEIMTSVPKDATTGYVVVTRVGKQLKSNVQFRVTQ